MKNSPIIISVAPNGALKTKEDHPHLPITPEELAWEAALCREAGAVLMHLHVRDKDGKHTLDVSRYKASIKAVRKAVKKNLIIQISSEAHNIYQPEQQMEIIRKLKPESVSISLREILSDKSNEKEVAQFLRWMRSEKIYPQYIIFSDKELRNFINLKERGIIPGDKHFVLFVLGRYTKGQASEPLDLLPFLSVIHELELEEILYWSVCAFGKRETNCMLAASLLGGHARVGFENNIHLSDGSIAQNNADMVKNLISTIGVTNREIALVDKAKKVVFCG